MLLFTSPSIDGDPSSWPESTSFGEGSPIIEVRLDAGRHAVSARSASDDSSRMAEVVSATALDPGDEPVSSFHLPPYYRWEERGFSCEFVAEWRDGPSSVAGALRHMQSLRPHPRALIVEASDGLVASAIVIGKQAEWRGWHVVDSDDPYRGPTRRLLATHTRIRGQVSPTSTS